MNKLIRLGKTGIEYGDYVWNFASGCGNQAEGKCNSGSFNCWAHSICQRFEGHYPNGFQPTVYPEALLSPLYLKKPSRILCVFMGDLFDDWFLPTMMVASANSPYGKDLKTKVYDTINACPQHTFLFLTKQPQNLSQWSPFPDNAWVGVSATDDMKYVEAFALLANIKAGVKYISFEPLLSRISDTGAFMKSAGLKWIIIGAQTKPYKQPKIEWVKEIVQAADKAGVKVFLKNNIRSLLCDALAAKQIERNQFFVKGDQSGYGWNLRQEMPKG